MSACVLPIAPEFQDPPAAANFAPVILDSDPPLGWVVTVARARVDSHVHGLRLRSQPSRTTCTSGGSRTFRPTRRTPATWSRTFQVTHSSNGLPLDQPVSVTPSCSAHNLAKIPQHQIMVVVADGPFDDSPPPAGMPVDLTRLKIVDGRDGRKKVIATWTLNLECP